MKAQLTPNQQIAVECHDKPLFIQAGAGTGKTFTLSKRIGYGLSEESGFLVRGIENLLVITFTEKAAGELMSRIRGELRERGLKDAALRIDGALISTIHGMCSRMLQAHALEAKIDPGAAMLSEEESAALLGQALEQQLQEAQGGHDFDQLVEALGDDAAFRLVKKLSILLSSAPEGRAAFEVGPAPQGFALRLLRGVLEKAQATQATLMELGAEEAGGNAAKAFAKLQSFISGLEEGIADGVDLNWIGADLLLRGLGVPKGGNAGKVFKPVFAEATEAIVEASLTARTAASWQELNIALDLAEKVCRSHKSKKEDLGARDTNDLLIDAYRLLKNYPDIAREYEELFDTVMIDEFQDTDPLQAGIVEMLCDENLSTLTTVGDAQQSIYAFRNADLETYRSVRKMMSAKGSQEVSLATNYRSHGEILSFVEAIFSHRDFFGNDFLKIEAGRKDKKASAWVSEGAPRVKLMMTAGYKQGGTSTATESLVNAEAQAIAQQFAQLAKDGAAYGDMAILMSSTNKAAPYLEAMRSLGIPCVVAGGSDYFKQREVRLLVNLLRFVELPEDDEALLDVLQSPLFDLSDDDLLAIRIVSRRELKRFPDDPRPRRSLWRALCKQAEDVMQDPNDPLVRAHEVLEWALENSGRLNCSTWVAHVVKASGWYAELQVGGVQACAVWANILRFMDLLDEYELKYGASFVGAAEHFREMCDLAESGMGGRGKLAALVSEGSDSVQVMTIHSSKGLEFPIVAVAQFERSASASSGEVLSLAENGTRALSLAYSKSGLEGSLSEDRVDTFAQARSVVDFGLHARLTSIERQREENQRLLYVALTRARDMLILCCCSKTFASEQSLGKGTVTAQLVEAILPPETALPICNSAIALANGQRVDYIFNAVPLDADENGEEAHSRLDSSRRHWLATEPEMPIITHAVRRKRDIASYSSIASVLKGESDELGKIKCQQIVLPQEEDRAKDTVSVVGSAFHSVAQWIAMQRVPSDANADSPALEERMSAACLRYRLDEDEGQRLLYAVNAWIGSQRFKEACAMGPLYSEHYFCVPVGDHLLEGFVDLLAVDEADGRALVIDYKTGFSGSVEELRQRYRLQASCYAYALLSTGVCRAVELAFVHPERNMLEVTYSFTQDDTSSLLAYLIDPC